MQLDDILLYVRRIEVIMAEDIETEITAKHEVNRAVNPDFIRFYKVITEQDNVPLCEYDVLVSELLEHYHSNGFPHTCFVFTGMPGREEGYIQENMSIRPKDVLEDKSAAIPIICAQEDVKTYLVGSPRTFFHKPLDEFFLRFYSSDAFQD